MSRGDSGGNVVCEGDGEAEKASMPTKCIDQMPAPIASAPPPEPELRRNPFRARHTGGEAQGGVGNEDGYGDRQDDEPGVIDANQSANAPR